MHRSVAVFQPDIEALCTVLSLCHTIRVDRHKPLQPHEYSHDASLYDYQASSPDEKALVEACARYSTVLIPLILPIARHLDVSSFLYIT